MQAVTPGNNDFAPEKEFEPKPDVSGLSHIPLRVLVLALLVLFVNSWFSAHLNVDLEKLLAVEAIGASAAAIVKFLGRDDEKAIQRQLRRAVEWLLGTRILAAASAILLIGTSLISSVTLFTGGVEGIGDVTFCAEGKRDCAQRKLARGDESVRFLRLTSPFGRPFFLDARGFRRYSFELFPWFPKIIRASTDLQRSPSILFRVAYPHSDVFDGEIRVVDAETGHDVARGNTTAECAALLVGPESQIPESFATRWARQLAAAGYQDSKVHPQAFERWFNPARDPTVTLTPGKKVNVYFFNRSQRKQNQKVPFTRWTAVARSVVIGGGSPQDVLVKRGQ